MTTQHVQQLAAQHARPLPWPITSPPRPPDAGPPPDHSPTLTEVAATPQQLAHLQRSLITVQEHMTALVLEVQARSRATALIEYGAEARYVPVCPGQGLPPFAPDTPEWFDWLATLTSFRFVGQLGRFHAHRETRRGQHTHS